VTPAPLPDNGEHRERAMRHRAVLGEWIETGGSPYNEEGSIIFLRNVAADLDYLSAATKPQPVGPIERAQRWLEMAPKTFTDGKPVGLVSDLVSALIAVEAHATKNYDLYLAEHREHTETKADLAAATSREEALREERDALRQKIEWQRAELERRAQWLADANVRAVNAATDAARYRAVVEDLRTEFGECTATSQDGEPCTVWRADYRRLWCTSCVVTSMATALTPSETPQENFVAPYEHVRIFQKPSDPAPSETPEDAPTVYDDVRAERERQNAKWGGPRHDDRHGAGDWFSYLHGHLEKAEAACAEDEGYNGGLRIEDGAEYRRRIIEVAALAVAAVETFDRQRPVQEVAL